MNEKLAKLEAEFSVLEEEMMKSEVISDQPKYQKMLARRREIEGAVRLFREMKNMKVC